MGAAAAANATMSVMSHFVFLVYSGGCVTSGMRARRPSNPLLLDRGIMVTALDRTEAVWDLDRVCFLDSLTRPGLMDLVERRDIERPSPSFSAFSPLPIAPHPPLWSTAETVSRGSFSTSWVSSSVLPKLVSSTIITVKYHLEPNAMPKQLSTYIAC